MRMLWTCLVAVLLAVPAHAEEPHPLLFHGLIIGGMGLRVMDMTETMGLLSRGPEFSEANRVLAPFSRNPVAFGALNAGMAVATNLAILKLHTHPSKRVRAVAWALLATEYLVSGYAVIYNARLQRGR